MKVLFGRDWIKAICKRGHREENTKINDRKVAKIGLGEMDVIFKEEIDKAMKEIVEASLKEGKLTQEQANILLKQTDSFQGQTARSSCR